MSNFAMCIRAYPRLPLGSRQHLAKLLGFLSFFPLLWELSAFMQSACWPQALPRGGWLQQGHRNHCLALSFQIEGFKFISETLSLKARSLWPRGTQEEFVSLSDANFGRNVKKQWQSEVPRILDWRTASLSPEKLKRYF